jgi:hypothetical protein
MYLFTDSKMALKEAVMRTSERVSAYELLARGRRLFLLSSNGQGTSSGRNNSGGKSHFREAALSRAMLYCIS